MTHPSLDNLSFDTRRYVEAQTCFAFAFGKGAKEGRRLASHHPPSPVQIALEIGVLKVWRRRRRNGVILGDGIKILSHV